MSQGRQFEAVAVTRFEIDHLRNFVVLLDHNPKLKEHAVALQQWIEDKTLRPTVCPAIAGDVICPDPENGYTIGRHYLGDAGMTCKTCAAHFNPELTRPFTAETPKV